MRAVVVFDGDCGLCNGFVAWLIRRDRAGAFRVTGSAGTVGREVLSRAGLGPEVAASSIVVWDGSATLRTDALARIARDLPWPWRAATALRAVPRPVRDAAYRAIAARRPRTPAADPACGTPPPALVARWRARLATADDIAAMGASTRL